MPKDVRSYLSNYTPLMHPSASHRRALFKAASVGGLFFCLICDITAAKVYVGFTLSITTDEFSWFAMSESVH